MDIEIKVPSMGESIVEATIGAILKPSGSVVKRDEEILELETDKVNQVVYAPAGGTVTLAVKSGDVVKVGQMIGKVAEGEGKSVSVKKPKMVVETPKVVVEKESVKETGGIRISIEESLEGKKEKEEKVLVKKEAGEVRKKMTKLRKTIAQRLVQVKNQTAMLTTFNEVDMSAVIQVREKEQEGFQKRHGVKLGFMSFFVKACVSALQKYPDVNGRVEGDEIVLNQRYDIGVAVSTEKGLMVPVIRGADRLSYAEIEKQLKEFAEKARSGAIPVDALQGGTFTITNGGVFGSLLSTPILNPPQSGILGMHNIVKRPVVVDDEIVIRPMMYLALSYDHRIVDGKESIGFLVHIKNCLEEPARLLLDL